MATHLTFNARRFLGGIDLPLLHRYFDRHQLDCPPTDLDLITGKAFECWLSELRSQERKALIIEELQQINDIASNAMGLLVDAHRRGDQTYDSAIQPQHHAMRLFLDHPDLFEYARSRYVLYAGGTNVATYYTDQHKAEVTAEAEERFSHWVQQRFAELGKGDIAQVHCYRDEGDLMIRATRGKGARTLTVIEDGQVRELPLLPAQDDLLVYDDSAGLLQIRTPFAADRDAYLDHFCEFFLGDIRIADQARNALVYDLSPIQNGTFDYGGNECIAGVTLRWVHLQISDQAMTDLQLTSNNMERSLEQTLNGLDLRAGKVLAVKLQFTLSLPNRRRVTKRTVKLRPPGQSDLAQDEYTPVINQYLAEQGVKLR